MKGGFFEGGYGGGCLVMGRNECLSEIVADTGSVEVEGSGQKDGQSMNRVGA
jgi:hypothetical protein